MLIFYSKFDIGQEVWILEHTDKFQTCTHCKIRARTRVYTPRRAQVCGGWVGFGSENYSSARTHYGVRAFTKNRKRPNKTIEQYSEDKIFLTRSGARSAAEKLNSVAKK